MRIRGTCWPAIATPRCRPTPSWTTARKRASRSIRVSGDVLPSTAGGDFFFELHYNLHAGNLGMYIVGLAGMLAFAAIIAGILIHKRIFKDFFTFRPAAGKQRAWLDAHNLTGVLGLPFHLLISYTGVIIFATSYMFAGVNAGYGGDINKLFTEAGDFYEREEVGKPLGKMTSIDALLDQARTQLGMPITWASIHHPHDASATIALGGDHSRHVAWNFHQATYDAADGRLLHVTKPPAAGYHTYEFLGGLHMVQFGGSLVRWLYFVLGLAGCVMIASGMQVWVRKRLKRVREAGAVSGYGLVRALNVGVVAGFPFAATAMLLANRLLPWSLADRASAEIAVFCVAWIGAAVVGRVGAIATIADGAICSPPPPPPSRWCPSSTPSPRRTARCGRPCARASLALAAVDLDVPGVRDHLRMDGAPRGAYRADAPTRRRSHEPGVRDAASGSSRGRR